MLTENNRNTAMQCFTYHHLSPRRKLSWVCCKCIDYFIKKL